jgi:hypothetical protein
MTSLSFSVYGRLFSNATHLSKVYIPGAITIVTGPGCVLPLTIAAAWPIVCSGFSSVPGFLSLPVLLSTYNASAIAFEADTIKTKPTKENRHAILSLFIIFFPIPTN